MDENSDIVELPILDAAYRADPQAALRAIAPPEHPLRRLRLPSGATAWILTDYDLGRVVLDDRRFSKQTPGASHFIFRHMLFCDPPDHTRLRAFVAAFFLKTRMEECRRDIRTACGRL